MSRGSDPESVETFILEEVVVLISPSIADKKLVIYKIQDYEELLVPLPITITINPLFSKKIGRLHDGSVFEEREHFQDFKSAMVRGVILSDLSTDDGGDNLGYGNVVKFSDDIKIFTEDHFTNCVPILKEPPSIRAARTAEEFAELMGATPERIGLIQEELRVAKEAVASRPPPPPPFAKVEDEVEDYLQRVGLGAWFVLFTEHLQGGVKSIPHVRATTAGDLGRMATKAKIQLDETTIQQVLNCFTKPPQLEEWEEARAASLEHLQTVEAALNETIANASAGSEYLNEAMYFPLQFNLPGLIKEFLEDPKNDFDIYLWTDQSKQRYKKLKEDTELAGRLAAQGDFRSLDLQDGEISTIDPNDERFIRSAGRRRAKPPLPITIRRVFLESQPVVTADAVAGGGKRRRRKTKRRRKRKSTTKRRTKKRRTKKRRSRR